MVPMIIVTRFLGRQRHRVTSTDAATITIVDGDNQRADATMNLLTDPLVVLVRDVGGRIVSGAPVTFTTSDWIR